MIPKAFPHQTEAYLRFKDSEILALLASMGTGKTRIIIDIMSHKVLKREHNRAVIIAPVAVHPQWVTEQLPLHCSIPYKAYSFKQGNLMKDIRERDKFMIFSKGDDNLRVFTINYESFVKEKGAELVQQFCATSDKPPMFILDEASRIKNPDVKTVINIKKLVSQYPDAWKAILTGTPAAKSPTNLWSLFDFLRKRYMGCSYQAFKMYHEVQFDRTLKIQKRLVKIRGTIDASTYMKIRRVIEKNGNSDKAKAYIMQSFGLTDEDYELIATHKNVCRFKNVDKLQEIIAKDTFSIDKSDCVKLPEKIYEQIKLKLNPEQKRLIKQLSKYAVADSDGEILTVEMKAQLGIRVLQICGGFLPVDTKDKGIYDTVPIKGVNQKVKFIVDDLEELGNQQFIVWAVFKDEIELLEKALSAVCTVGTLAGATKKGDRVVVVEDFKAGKLQGLISHPSVGGFGLNLQCAGVQYWYSRDYRTEARLQAEDRSHRIGTVKSPIYKDLLSESAFEHRVLEVLQEGKDINDHFVTASLNDLFTLEK